jgi:hypothetical protein
MKRLSLLFTGIAALIVLAVAAPSLAAEKAQERTITGEAKCAKCMLKEGDKCQTIIQSESRNGKTVTYYLAENGAAKNFHENVCKEAKKITATGTVRKVDGKVEFTAAKIEVIN